MNPATAVGAYENVRADSIKAGDKIVLLANTTDASAGFLVAAVETSTAINASGIYAPGIETPYITADGMVVPL